MGKASEKQPLLDRPVLKSSSLRKPLLTPSATLKISRTSIDTSADSVTAVAVQHKQSTLLFLLTAALRTASRLSNLLPTAVFLLFQILCPVITNGGNCTDSIARQILSTVLLCTCSVLCVIATFTDSFTASDGRLHHGFITLWGLWTPHLEDGLLMRKEYMLTWTDVIHAVLSLTVFLALSLFDRNLRYCLYPDVVPDVLASLMPTICGFLFGIIFMLFPTKRRGIGFLVVGETYVEVRVDGLHQFQAEAPPLDVQEEVAKVLDVLDGDD